MYMVASSVVLFFLAKEVNTPNSAPHLMHLCTMINIMILLYVASFNEHFENACQQEGNKSTTPDTTLQNCPCPNVIQQPWRQVGATTTWLLNLDAFHTNTHLHELLQGAYMCFWYI